VGWRLRSKGNAHACWNRLAGTPPALAMNLVEFFVSLFSRSKTMAQMDLATEGGQQNTKQQSTSSGGHTGAQQNGLQRSYQVREVTNYQASWTEQSPGKEGKFTVQLILDNGVQEHILQVCAEDLDVLLSLLKRSRHTMFDVERCVLMFSNLDAA
jgi:hypothetical protein